MNRSIIALLVLAACGDEPNMTENELITTVTLTFSPTGGAASTFEWNDPDGDGGNAPTIDPVSLAPATTYTLAVAFQNRLVTPPEEITDEIRDESDHHQLFFIGSAVNGPATSNPSAPLTHSYGDTDVNGFPIGLTNSIVAAAGSGQLTVVLRHMPPEEPPEKAADTAALVKAGGIDSIGGTTDAKVDFMVTVP